MRFALMVTGPAYGTQQASSALQFAHALLAAGHELASVFFYREGVYNANQFTSPASDEFDLVRAWQALNEKQGVELNICVAAALRRGVTDATEADRLGLSGANLQPGFSLSGLGALAQAAQLIFRQHHRYVIQCALPKRVADDAVQSGGAVVDLFHRADHNTGRCRNTSKGMHADLLVFFDAAAKMRSIVLC